MRTLTCLIWLSASLCATTAAAQITIEGVIANLESSDGKKQDQGLWDVSRMWGDSSAAIPALVKLLDDAETRRRERAIDALRSMHSSAQAAVLRLTALLKHQTPSTRVAAAEAIWDIARSVEVVSALVTELNGADADSRERAVRLLCRMGPEASRAAPDMVALLSGPPEVRERAVRVLEAIAPAERASIVRPLRTALADDSSVVRALAASALWKLDAAPGDLLSVLIDVLREKPATINRERWVQFTDDAAARKAARALGNMGPDARPAVPALIEARSVPHYGLQDAAARALGDMGPEAREAIPALAKLVVTGDGLITGFHSGVSLPETAVHALVQIGPDSIPALLGLLSVKDCEYRTVWALANLPSHARESVDPVAALLDDGSDPQLRARAALALARFGPAARPAAPRIIARLHDDAEIWTDYEMGGFHANCIGDCMAEALIRMEADPEAVVPAVMELVEKSGTLRDASLRVLRDFGPRAKRAVPALERLLQREESRDLAAMALAHIEPDHPEVLKVLDHAFYQEHKLHAMRAVGDLGLRAAEFAPELAKRATPVERDRRWSAHAVAAAAWLQVSPDNEAAMRTFAETLRAIDCSRPLGYVETEAPGFDEIERIYRKLARKDVVRPILLEGLRYVETQGTLQSARRDQSHYRLRSAELLLWLDPEATEPLDVLCELLLNPPPKQDWDHPTEMGRAADILARLVPPPASALDALIKTLSHDGRYLIGGDQWGHGSTRHNVGDHAAAAVAQLGAVAVPRLRETLLHTDPDTRRRAAECLGKIGPAAQDAADDLLRALRTGDARLRAAAAAALGKIQPNATGTVEALVEGLQDSRLAVRIACANSLGNYGPSAIPSLKALTVMQAEPFDTARAAATEAINKIGN